MSESLELTESISFYRQNREKLIKIHITTETAFNEIAEILKKSVSGMLGWVNLDNLSNISEELGGPSNEEMTKTINSIDDDFNVNIVEKHDILNIGKIDNPAIAVIGQVKAGKSTFVNVLLRKNVVTQAFERCTARLTRLQYSEKNYIEIIDKNGEILKRKVLKSSTIPKKYVNLNEEDRNNPDEINKQIVAGINSQFLKCGIDLIDSPGLSENETLDKMSKGIAKNILPVMIYVIDGCTSVKQTDINYLLELKAKSHSIQIIYFITKLDPADDNKTLTEQDRIEKAKEKLDIAFKKLQFNNLIPTDKYKTWSDCPYFHGASLHFCTDYLNKIYNSETTFHYEQFQKFQKALNNYLVEKFEFKILDTCDCLLDFQLNVLTKIIRRAQVFADFTKDNLKQIKQIKSNEEEIYKKIKSVILESKDQLKLRLIERLEGESEKIIEPIKELKYPENVKVPENGIVSDEETIQACCYTIMTMVCQSLENLILQFVEEELFEKYKRSIEDESRERINNELNNPNMTVKTPYRITLDRMLASKYKFTALKDINNEVQYKNLISKFVDRIYESIRKIFRSLFRQSNQLNNNIDVFSIEWKCNKAKEMLSKINHQLLADEVCKDLLKDFDERHNAFLKALEIEFEFVQKDIVVAEVTRQLIADKAPDFTVLLMLTLDVKSSYTLKNLEIIKQIGKGAQAAVYHCKAGDKNLAMKTALVPINTINTTAEEVYYSYLLNHPRMLTLEGVMMNNTEDKPDHKTISMFYPLMKCDLLDYLKNNKTEFKVRMKYGLEIAEALQYLHKEKIMHRDLKLANILISENNDVYLADYGLCKSTSLTGHTFVGTPVFMAPEIIRRELYDYKVDIFSFGILLWYLAEGTGRHPIYVNLLGEATKVLIAGSEFNMRPERLSSISDELWNLMEICWDKEKVNRPDINIVIEKLKHYIDNSV